MIAVALALGIAIFAGGPVPAALARERVDDARRALRAGDLDRAAEALAALGDVRPTALAGPEDAPADVRREAIRTAERRLDAIERELDDAAAPRREGRDARAAVREILAERQFQPETRPPPVQVNSDRVDSLLQRFENWLFRRRPQIGEPPNWFFQWLGDLFKGIAALPWNAIWAAILVILALLLLRLALKYLRAPALGRQAPRAAGGDGVIADALAHDAASLREEGLRLLARGERRAALRAFYVGMLSVLHRKRVLALEPPKTNWEHVEKLKPRADLHAAIVPHTRAFDFAWYGRRDPETAEVEAARATLDDFIALPTDERGAPS